MTFAARLTLILMMTMALAFARDVFAQEAATTTTTTTATAEPSEAGDATTTATAEKPGEAEEGARELTSYEVRSQFGSLLRQSPPSLARLLVLDPNLMSNSVFLDENPRLKRFLAEHPEVVRNPRFYLEEFDLRPIPRESAFEEMLEAITIVAAFALVAFALGWLVRTIIEQKRWNKLSRTQAEVHNKILDRFGTTAELLEYVKTPAGTKFLESAPIPLYTDRKPQHPPQSRVLWSIQIGVIIAAAALGLLLASTTFSDDSAQGLFAMGVIALSIGAGFIASAMVSVSLSRRLGLLQPPPERDDEPGLVR
jgi:hypothetical protein